MAATQLCIVMDSMSSSSKKEALDISIVLLSLIVFSLAKSQQLILEILKSAQPAD